MVDRSAILTAFWASSSDTTRTDYALLGRIDTCFAARTRGEAPALVVPLLHVPVGAVGRRAAGFELAPQVSLRFSFEGREWDGAAATLVCTDAELGESFAVLAADLAFRVKDGATWRDVVEIVSEWQALLTPKGRPSTESEIGLWGELWFLERAADIDRTLAGWRGPEQDSTDFFLDGVAAEVKTSRALRTHHVSQSQVGEPVGGQEGWLLSIWVKVDPGGVTVPALFDQVCARTSDRAGATARIARAGYSNADRRHYLSGFTLLQEPEWYPAGVVPRVRVADPGVSQLRFRVSLDEHTRADQARASTLWLHFHGRTFGGVR